MFTANIIKGWCIFFIVAVSVLVVGLIINDTKDLNIKCIDGDTFAIGKTYYRLAYIDTPEKGYHNYKASSKYTCDYLTNNKIDLKITGKDAYGRKLVVVNGNNYYSLNDLLVKDCLAVPFYGKTNKKILDLFNNCK